MMQFEGGFSSVVLTFLIFIQAVNGSGTAQQSASDWQEYDAADGRR